MPGPYSTSGKDIIFVDASRITARNGQFQGADARTLNTTIWYPENAGGEHPLVVYSHGFMSNRHGGRYMAENLASHGYVVVAADHPLTHGDAAGGPLISDVSNQPGDISFLINSVLALSTTERPYQGQIDASRIGVAGISLGGLTATLTAFHPRMRDLRIKAAISIAGPASSHKSRY